MGQNLCEKTGKKVRQVRSVRAKVSAASVDLTARFNLVELQAIGVRLLNLSHRKTINPP